ncbi:MAG: hypothetical protein Q4P11_01690 [Methanobrevibacter sp.]|nr:hypothetical protein [Methanobrevibacter sp.]
MKFSIGNGGQLSLEYILSSMIVIMVISLISVPILLATMDYSGDVIDAVNSKGELSKVTDAIDYCYASGKGSRRTVYLDLNQNLNLHLYNNGKTGICSVTLNLSDNSREMTGFFDYPYLNENIHLSKGINKVIVEWNEESDRIEVKKSI